MAPKKTNKAAAAAAEATKVAAEQKEETTSTTTTKKDENNNAGPAAPPNEAGESAKVYQINKQRLVRFTRPLQAGKKGAVATVPPRQWREDNKSAETAVTEDGDDNNNKNNSSSNNNNKVPVLITKELVEELTSKLGPIDLQRAANKQDPIPVISTEAANIRAKRFHTETPQEMADKRLNRFEAEKNAAAPQANTLVDPEIAAKREARWGVTLAQPPRQGGVVASNANKIDVPVKELSEAEKKRLDRFK